MLSPLHFLEFLEPIIAIGDSRCACSAQREVKGHGAFRLVLAVQALIEVNPQNTALGCKQLSGRILLSRYQKAGIHAAGF